MEIFVSWSGELSKEIGEIFSDWIPAVLQVVKPYFTPDDIEKGARWSNEIAKELQQSEIGIIVLTRDNLLNPWIMFEAGALSKQMETSRICVILFGLENTDLVGPLVQFQATSFKKGDVKKLVKTINNACGDNKLTDDMVDNVFEKWWPELEQRVNSVMGKERDKGSTELRSERELIEEILSLTRMSAAVERREPDEIGPALDDLMRIQSRLKKAVEVEDMEVIRKLCERLEMPADFIYRRNQRARDRVERERWRLVVSPEEEREGKKEEG